MENDLVIGGEQDGVEDTDSRRKMETSVNRDSKLQ